MSKPFDASLNRLIDDHPADWAAFLAARTGVPAGPAEPVDTDMSLTLQSDKAFRVNGPVPAIVHLELESGSRLGIPTELLRYNVLTHAVTGLPVHTVLVLLRPRSNPSDVDGTHHITGADGSRYLTFRYTVIRVWEESVAGFLAAGPGIAPLAMLTNEAITDPKATLGRLQDRLRASNIPSNVTRELFGLTFVLCGLRYDPARIEDLCRELSMTLEDSASYHYILQKGITQGITQNSHGLILRLGQKRFGPATPSAEATVRAIKDPARLERLAERVLDATGWDDLLATV